jgi:hypothetical protein
MRKAIIGFVFIMAITALHIVSVPGLYAFDQALNDEGMQEIRTENGIVMGWRTEGPSLIIRISAPSRGWVAVGFEPTQAMKDANFLIAYVKDGTVYVRDDYGTERGKHAADTQLGGKNDVKAISGNEKDGITEVTFSIPLDSGDVYDKPLLPGNEYLILLAFGKSDSFSAVHEIEAEAKGSIRL